ncbi:MAG: murein biosynthesis integral membrane protein MurJ [Eubacterium callanderi]|uniref:murein biosynthesis integral membrane protein MurJ n=1 Tax=Eubacterium callanderi TaxID=53442 RepID=UPI003996ABE1
MIKGILVSTGALTAIMIIGKIFGFVNQTLIAFVYGANTNTDIFFLASGLISNLFYSVTSGLVVIVLPIYKVYSEQYGKEKSECFITKVSSFFLIISFAIYCILFFLAPIISKILAPSYTSNELSIMINYIRVLGISIFFVFTINIYTAVLNANRKYVLARSVSCIYSLVSIIFISLFSKKMGVMALVLAFPISYFIQLLFVQYGTRQYVKIHFTLNCFEHETKDLLIKLGPVLIGSATIQINQFIDRMLASMLEPGAVSALSYSAVFNDFVSVVFVSSIITVLFTELSETAAKSDNIRLTKFLRNGIININIILIPVSIITFMNSTSIVTIIYGRGAFSSDAIHLTAQALQFYSIGFLFEGIRELIAKTFYAFGNTKTPTYYGVLSVVLNIILSIVLSRFMGIGGITLATSMSALISSFLLLRSLKSILPEVKFSLLFSSLGKVVIAGTIEIILIFFLSKISFFDSQLLKFIVTVSIACLVYLLSLKFLKCYEIIQLTEKIKNIIRRK